MPLNQYDKTTGCELKQMYQECSMRVTKVADSPMFCDKTENTSLFTIQYISQSIYKSICRPRVIKLGPSPKKFF